jgi:hypothetical protein
LLGDVDQIVIPIPVNQLVVGIDASQSGRLVNNDHESLVFVGKFFLLKIEGLLFIFLSAENTDLDVISEGHGCFSTVAVGLHLAGLHLEGHLIFSVSSFLRGGGYSFVVVKNDPVEAVVDQILELGRSLSPNGVHQHARVRIRAVEASGSGRMIVGVNLVVGVGVAVLHEEIVEREIEFVFADVVGKGVENLATLLVPDIGLALDQSQWRLVAELAGAAPQISIELVPEVAMHEVRSVLVRHDLEGGVFGETFRHHVGAFDIGADELVGPPLMAKFVGGDEVGVVDVSGLQYATDKTDALGVRNGVCEGLGESAVARIFHDAVLSELIGTEDPLIVVEAGARARELASMSSTS